MRYLKLIYYILFFTALSQISYSQTDTTGILKTDTLTNSSDTLGSPLDSLKASSDIDALINYSASDSAVFDLKNNKLYLYDKAEVTYKDLKINSGVIIIDRETQVIEAIGLPDTVTAGEFTQLPLMYEGETKYEGSIIRYNFKTQQGTASMGYTEADIGYYYGEKIKKVNDEVFFIKNGVYTTSTNREDPEYYFTSPRMKVIPDDKIIAQSVFLYIEGVPVFWIPFAVFPDRGGRSSGIIPPTWGDDATYGQYISKFGYFWAINDYMDVNGMLSYFTKGRIDISSRFRYALKYNFYGSVDAGYSRIRQGEDNDPNRLESDQWLMSFIHDQSIDPSTRISANMTFLSGRSYYDNSTNNLNELLQQNVVSNFTLSKYWEGTPYSLNVNYNRDQNLITNSIRELLPSVSFTNTETFPFRKNLNSLTPGDFYEYFSYSYNGSFVNRRLKLNIPLAPGIDSTVRDNRLGAQHIVNFNFAPPSSYINFRPFFNYVDLWYNKSITKTFNPADSSLTTNTIEGFKRAGFFRTGVSVNTNFVGIFTPKIFNITGIRHTITPAVTYSYRPDFSDPSYGYYGSYVNASGQTVKYSFFENEIFGGAPFGEEQAISFSVYNLFEMKTRVNDTTENRFKLFDFNATVGYNFAADSLKFSEVRTDFRTEIGSLLNIAGGATFNLYRFDPTSQQRVNTFLFNTDGRLFDVTSFNINLATSYNFDFTSRKKNANDSLIQSDSEVDYYMPFSGTFNYNYSENKFNPTSVFRSSNLSGGLQFNLTKNWRFTVAASYDFLNREIGAPYITAYRDLNSWEANFNWYPTGFYKGFRFEVRIKAPELRDIKVTKQTSTRGVFGDF